MDVEQEPIDKDPRPELEEDSKVWELTLKLLKKADIQLAINMKFLRCGGARLRYNDEEDKYDLKIEDDSEYSAKEFQKYIKELIKPHAKKVRKALDKVREKLKEVESK